MAHLKLKRSRKFSALGLFALALLAVACTVVLSLIPLYVSKGDFNIINNTNNISNTAAIAALQDAKNSLTSLSTSYMLPPGYGKKRAAASITNRELTAVSLQQQIGAAKGSISVIGIFSLPATGLKGRRRR
ncbi:unnamed protein product, partial [Adineta steineri]